jgi:hypothetical protein
MLAARGKYGRHLPPTVRHEITVADYKTPTRRNNAATTVTLRSSEGDR